MHYLKVDRETFYRAVDQIPYRAQDIQEANEFGCTDIKACYDKSVHKFGKYFLVYDDLNVPIVTVMLQRDGHIIFFISNNVTNNLGLIRVLKALSNSVTSTCGAIITKTAYWYTEAQRLNRIIGFKDYILYDYHGLYVKE